MPAQMPMQLAGRTAVVTGAASGIGRALAMAALERGMPLAVCDIAPAGLQDLRAAAAARGVPCVADAVDVRDRTALGDFAGRIAAELPPVALLCANAGVLRAGLAWSLPAAEADLIIDVNIKGVLNTLAVFLPGLLSGTGRSHVVVTGSRSAFVPTAIVSIYAASKNAVWSLAETLRQQMIADRAPVGVTFLAPGAVRTAIAGAPLAGVHADVQQGLDRVLQEHGLPPEDVAAATFQAVSEGRFWVFTDPTFKPDFGARAAAVLEERDP